MAHIAPLRTGPQQLLISTASHMVSASPPGAKVSFSVSVRSKAQTNMRSPIMYLSWFLEPNAIIAWRMDPQ